MQACTWLSWNALFLRLIHAHTHLYSRAATLWAVSYEQCLHREFIPSLRQTKPGVRVTEGSWAVPISYSSLWHQWNQQSVTWFTVSLCLDKAKPRFLHCLPQWFEVSERSLCRCRRCLRTHHGSRRCFHLVPLTEARQIPASGALGYLILWYLQELCKQVWQISQIPCQLWENAEVKASLQALL